MPASAPKRAQVASRRTRCSIVAWYAAVAADRVSVAQASTNRNAAIVALPRAALRGTSRSEIRREHAARV
jgi:hypothetical protein